jgi:hypothetical protein
VRGRTAYFGPRASAPTYFAEVGFPVPELSNPADHYLYITNVDFFDDKEAGQQVEVVIGCWIVPGYYLG